MSNIVHDNAIVLEFIRNDKSSSRLTLSLGIYLSAIKEISFNDFGTKFLDQDQIMALVFKRSKG